MVSVDIEPECGTFFFLLRGAIQLSGLAKTNLNTIEGKG